MEKNLIQVQINNGKSFGILFFTPEEYELYLKHIVHGEILKLDINLNEK